MYEFPQSGSWKDFYETFGIDVSSEENHGGWISINCPVHPHDDHGKKAGVNIYSGNFRCFNTECSDKYKTKLHKRPDSEAITAREFLIYAYNFSSDEAYFAVQTFRQSLPEETKQTDRFVKSYRANPEWQKEIEEAQSLLNPNSDIVREYCESKGIKFDTLLKTGAGLFHQDEMEILLFPYYLDKSVVGIRARNISGDKTSAKGSYSCPYNLDYALSTGAKTCIVVEGESDCLFLQQILWENARNIPVISTPGAYFKSDWKRYLQPFNRIIAVPQYDDAATKLIADLRRNFQQKLEIISMPWSPVSKGKDVVDFCKQHDPEKLLQLIGTDDNVRKRVLDGNEMIEMGQVETPYLIPGLIERGTKTLIVGEPKTYKTFIALQLMDSIVNQTPFMGMEQWTPNISGMKAMLVEEEGSYHRMGQRLEKVTQGVGAENMIILHRQNIKLDDKDSFMHLCNDLLEHKPDILIFDPYASLHSQEENSATGTAITTEAMNNLLRLVPTMSIVIIHHSTKANPKSPRGSSALWGQMDELITVSRKDKRSITVDVRGRDLADDETVHELMFVFDGNTGKHAPFTLRKKEIKQPKEEEEEEVGKDFRFRNSLADRLKTVFEFDPHREFTQTEIIDKFDSNQGATVSAAYNTVKAALDELVESGFVSVTGLGKRGSPRLYKYINQKAKVQKEENEETI
jgi:hypothetical protein